MRDAFGILVLNSVMSMFLKVYAIEVASGKLVKLKFSKAESRNALLNMRPVGNGVLNEVSPLPCHALVKFTFSAAVPSFAPAGNDVRAVQPCHAFEKFAPLGISVVPKSESEEQLYQA